MGTSGHGNTDLTEALTEILARRGIIDKNDTSGGVSQDRNDSFRKFAYHNTRLLLKNYRQIVWQSQLQTVQVAASLELPMENMDAILSRIDAEIGMNNRKVEARLEVLRRFRLMISQINEALSLLKQKPDNGEVLYELIYLTYIHPTVLKTNDIIERLTISRRHYFRLRKEATAIISTRLWGAPAPGLEIWMELLDRMAQ